MAASSMLSRASTLVNYGHGQNLQSMLENQGQSPLHHDDLQSIFANTIEKIQEEYIEEEKGILYRKGQKYLSKLYEKNDEFREGIINFFRDKTELDLKEILERRYKTNTLNTTGKEYLAKYILSKDNTADLIEILAKYDEYN